MKKGTLQDGLVYHAGFPNAGEDQHGVTLSLDKLVVKHRASTYFWRLQTSIAEVHWPAGTIVVVDRAEPVREGRIVVAIVNEAFVLARYRKDGFHTLTGNNLGDQARLWGVVTYVVQDVAVQR